MTDEGVKLPGIDKLETVADLLHKKPLEVNAKLCVRARNRVSDCDRCSRVCPVGAVVFKDESIDPVAVDFAACNGCGACVGDCPTGVFNVSDGLSDYDLVKKIALTVGESGRREVVFACRRVDPRIREQSIGVTCFARLHEGLLLAPAYFEAAKAHLLSHDCANCDYKQHAAIAARVKDMSELMRGFGFKTKLILTEDQETIAADLRAVLIEREQPTRRELLEGLGGFLKKHSASWAEQKMAPFMRRQKAVVVNGFVYQTPYKRKILLGLVKDRKCRKSVDLPSMHFGEIDFSAQKCDLCGDCARFCPTTALAVETHNDGSHLVFYPAYCVHCGICETLCRPQAIALKTRVNLADLASASGRSLKAAAGKYECVLCQSEFSGAEPKAVCPTCYELQRLAGNADSVADLEPVPVAIPDPDSGQE